jgi:outer membrane biosynthesis protein TonB
MSIAQLFSNLAVYHDLEYEFSESLEALYSLEFEETGIQIKQILESVYKDGITGLENVQPEEGRITGIFLDRVASGLTKRFKFEITEDEITHEPEDPDAMNFSEVDFATVAKEKKCVKGMSCGNSCVPLKQPNGEPTKCRSKPPREVTGSVAQVLAKSAKAPKQPKGSVKQVQEKVPKQTQKSKAEKQTAKGAKKEAPKLEVKKDIKPTDKEEKKETKDVKQTAQEQKTSIEIPKNYKNFSMSADEKAAYSARLQNTPEDSDEYSSYAFAQDKKYPGLDISEAAALNNYSKLAYAATNKYLRSDNDAEKIYKSQDSITTDDDSFVYYKKDKNRLEEDTIADIRAITSALNKLPDYDGIVYRGTPIRSLTPEQIEANYLPGSIITEKGFTSTSASSGAKFDGEVQYEIKSRTGKKIQDLSQYKGENEVLFRPDTKFKVTGFEKIGNTYKIKMEEE